MRPQVAELKMIGVDPKPKSPRSGMPVAWLPESSASDELSSTTDSA